ncbi:DUF2391 family protein [Candidatus Woesearchaeota archaeon]|nr:DUF2391 family protein [Candidatus Woesearchaeota archaeon]
MLHKDTHVKRHVVRIHGKLHEVTSIHDNDGNTLHRIVNPLKVEFLTKDFLQVLIGASVLAIPVGFTEETWQLGENLPLINCIGFVLLSLLFISIFAYFHYYKEHDHFQAHRKQFMKRVFTTYLVAFVIVAGLMALIQRTPWFTDPILAFKRIVLVTFPCSMSATVADNFK